MENIVARPGTKTHIKLNDDIHNFVYFQNYVSAISQKMNDKNLEAWVSMYLFIYNMQTTLTQENLSIEIFGDILLIGLSLNVEHVLVIFCQLFEINIEKKKAYLKKKWFPSGFPLDSSVDNR